MLAIDTNVFIRIVTNDDPVAAEQARHLVSENVVYLGATVLLECAWVLSRRYGFPPAAVVEAIRLFVGLPGVVVEAQEEVRQALGWAEERVEFADALHLALTASRGPFATFDRKLLKQARDRGVAVVEP